MGGILKLQLFKELWDRLKTRFGQEGQRSRYKAELNARKRRKGETLQNLSSDIARLMGLAYEGERSTHRDDMAVDKFLAALEDEELKLKVMECEPTNLAGALKHAQSFESYRMSIEGAGSEPQGRRRNREDYQARAVTNDSSGRNGNGALTNTVAQVDENTQLKIQHLERNEEDTARGVRALVEKMDRLRMQAAAAPLVSMHLQYCRRQHRSRSYHLQC